MCSSEKSDKILNIAKEFNFAGRLRRTVSLVKYSKHFMKCEMF